MNRTEALRTLGLGPDAQPEDIRIAYKETAQILHPDRFAGNKKLQDRATEQFKHLQEAYEFLRADGSSGRGRGSAGARTSGSRGADGTWRGGASGGAGRSAGADAWSPGAGAARSHVEVDEDGNEVEYVTDAEIRARLAGIAAARTQLVAQRDALLDERRNGLAMLAIGAVVALLTGRRAVGILGAIAGLASAAAIWGGVQAWSSHKNIASLNGHLSQLAEQRREYEALLDE